MTPTDTETICHYCAASAAICPSGTDAVGEPICHACAELLTDDCRRVTRACHCYGPRTVCHYCDATAVADTAIPMCHYHADEYRYGVAS